MFHSDGIREMQVLKKYICEKEHFEQNQFVVSRELSGLSLFEMELNDYSSDQEQEGEISKSSRKVIYSCTFPGCDGVFNSTSNKKRHERLHSGEKPHKCEYSGCGKSFARKYDLKVHIRTHTKEKPYTCDVVGCGKRFSRNSSLREHERNIHNMAVGQKFRARGELRKQLYSFESKFEKQDGRRNDRDTKVLVPLDLQSKAQVQQLVSLFKASQGDLKGGEEGRAILPREFVANLLDITKERTLTKISEFPKIESEPDSPPFLPPFHQFYPNMPMEPQGTGYFRSQQDDVEGADHILWQDILGNIH